MSVTPAYFLSLSLSYLRAMIGDSEVWRAVVAQPDTDWTTLQTLINAETSSGPNALARIVYGRWEEDADHDDYIPRPRCILRHYDQNDAERASTTGFASKGVIYVGFEIPIPTVYRDDARDAYLDAENKIGGIVENLSGMGRVNGYLDLNEISLTGFGQADPDENNGEWFYVSELAVQHLGSVLP